MKTETLDQAYFKQVREAQRIARARTREKPSGRPPDTLLQILRLQNPERVRQDAARPGEPRTEVVLDDGPNAGLGIAMCKYEYDAKLIVEIWNWARTLKPKDKPFIPAPPCLMDAPEADRSDSP